MFSDPIPIDPEAVAPESGDMMARLLADTAPCRAQALDEPPIELPHAAQSMPEQYMPVQPPALPPEHNPPHSDPIA